MLAGASLDWGGATSVGRVRRLNEDALVTEPPVFAVADGMGGHDAGEVASALTVERLRGLTSADQEVTMEVVAAELQEVNGLLRDASPDSEDGMGTTGVGLVLLTGVTTPSWLVFNVGDSRAYCIDEGDLVQISRDHSYVQELVDAGELTPQAAERHPHRHVITRALGIDEVVRADYWVRPVRPGERYLLCSDGLFGEVDQEEIRSVLLDGGSPEATAVALVERAVDAGGRDNVTTIVVDVLDVVGWDDTTTGGRGASGPRHGSTVDEVEIDTVDRAAGDRGGAATGEGPSEHTIPRPPPPSPPSDDELISGVPGGPRSSPERRGGHTGAEGVNPPLIEAMPSDLAPGERDRLGDEGRSPTDEDDR